MLLTYRDCFVLLNFIKPKLNNFTISDLGIEYLRLNKLLENSQHFAKEFEQKREELVNLNIKEFFSQDTMQEDDFALIKTAVANAFQNPNDLDNFINNNETLKPLKEKLSELINILFNKLNDLFVENIEVNINFSKLELQKLYDNFKKVLNGEQLLQFDFLFNCLLED